MHGGRRRVAAALTLAIAGTAAVAVPSAQGATTPLRVSVLTMEQQEVLRAPELRLRVTAARAGTVRLAVTTSVGMDTVGIAPAKRVAFDRPGTKTVTVRLSDLGNELLTRCSTATRVRVGATLRAGERTLERAAFRTLRGEPRLCSPPPPPQLPAA